MDNDDQPVGRVLSRREALMLLGAAGAAALAACAPGQSGSDQAMATLNAEAQTAEAIAQNPTAVEATQAEVATVAAGNTTAPTCVVRPEQTEGPYFVDVQLDRSDIREEPSTGELSEGLPLALNFNVSQIANGACTPLAGATVDIWHCDNATDGIFQEETLLTLTEAGSGYSATFDIALDLSDAEAGADDSAQGGGPGGGGSPP